jgi:hypothetical protein
MTPKGANLQATDLLEISELSGTGYITKSITGQQIINAGGGGGSQNLQQVTDIGNETTNILISTSGFATLNSFIDPNEFSILQNNLLELTNNITSHQLFLTSSLIQFVRGVGDIVGTIKATNVTNNVTLEFPNKTTGSYTIATTADIPTVSGFVPYTGATANVNLGTFHLDAGKGTFNHNGSTDTLTANHTSGSGIGLSITKGGANEGLKVNKTSGSGNAATIIGTLEATTLVKTGGTSSQFLMADGSTNTNVVPTSRTLNGFDLSADRTFTTAVIADSSNKRYQTDNQQLFNDATSSIQTQLDAKQSKLLVKKLGASATIATTVESIIGNVEILGGTLANTDYLNIRSRARKTGAIGTYLLRYYLNTTSNSLTGATQIAISGTQTTSSIISTSFERDFTIDGGNLIGFPFGTASNDGTASASTVSSVAYTVATTYYIITTITLASALDTASLIGQKITNV